MAAVDSTPLDTAVLAAVPRDDGQTWAVHQTAVECVDVHAHVSRSDDTLDARVMA
eukprot:CAMPEP_0202700800 /NCGR_PEP_ID=MMETSP1385-20130828/13961_1 /ASSEMBLY_ACC=CAM_ASM_000861 /TAXON_ID=933848 /ORGANISM="Elphidium margaritaceum" /LENGTH=54 /DNA_ID=CAMNT_0049358069 /DNA_START=117 /DNA_END=277 /DNA_ORIENTATION=-